MRRALKGLCVHEVMIEQQRQEAPAAYVADESSSTVQKNGASVFCPVVPSKKSGAAFCPVVVGEEGVETVVASVDKATVASTPQAQKETSA